MKKGLRALLAVGLALAMMCGCLSGCGGEQESKLDDSISAMLSNKTCDYTASMTLDFQETAVWMLNAELPNYQYQFQSSGSYIESSKQLSADIAVNNTMFGGGISGNPAISVVVDHDDLYYDYAAWMDATKTEDESPFAKRYVKTENSDFWSAMKSVDFPVLLQDLIECLREQERKSGEMTEAGDVITVVTEDINYTKLVDDCTDIIIKNRSDLANVFSPEANPTPLYPVARDIRVLSSNMPRVQAMVDHVDDWGLTFNSTSTMLKTDDGYDYTIKIDIYSNNATYYALNIGTLTFHLNTTVPVGIVSAPVSFDEYDMNKDVVKAITGNESYSVGVSEAETAPEPEAEPSPTEESSSVETEPEEETTEPEATPEVAAEVQPAEDDTPVSSPEPSPEPTPEPSPTPAPTPTPTPTPTPDPPPQTADFQGVARDNRSYWTVGSNGVYSSGAGYGADTYTVSSSVDTATGYVEMDNTYYDYNGRFMSNQWNSNDEIISEFTTQQFLYKGVPREAISSVTQKGHYTYCTAVYADNNRTYSELYGVSIINSDVIETIHIHTAGDMSNINAFIANMG